MADIFLKITGIEGESSELGHVGEIELLSWTWDIAVASQYLSGSGGGANKASMSDLHFVHAIDRASPILMRYALTGQRVPKAILTMRKAGGTPLDFLKIAMEVVQITAVKPVAASGSNMESVKLSFVAVKQEYIVQNAAGGSGGTVSAAFDLRANRGH